MRALACRTVRFPAVCARTISAIHLFQEGVIMYDRVMFWFSIHFPNLPPLPRHTLFRYNLCIAARNQRIFAKIPSRHTVFSRKGCVAGDEAGKRTALSFFAIRSSRIDLLVVELICVSPAKSIILCTSIGILP